jgi:MYXO-CTERM domain-containing protein
MKRHIWASSLALLVAAGATSLPASAQQGGEADRANQADERDNNGEWGWIGLLGLAGLAGLKRRDRDDRTHTSTHGHAPTR